MIERGVYEEFRGEYASGIWKQSLKGKITIFM